ncbi:MAG TPA: HAD-IA family hydrolase [Nitrospiria bacterium]|jgi:phosphoglycolate phosphatase
MICIDLDGTLEDSRSDMVAAVQRVRENLRLSFRSDGDIRPFVNKGMDQLYHSCFDDYIQDNHSRFAEVRGRYESDYIAHVAVETQLYPGIKSALRDLKDLGSITVVTNKPEKISRQLLEALGIDLYISDVIGGDTLPKTKPDPLVLETAAHRCDFQKSIDGCFMIGDTDADIKMGKAFGCKTIWCQWGYLDRPKEKPDFIAEKPAQLPHIVRSTLKNELPHH